MLSNMWMDNMAEELRWDVLSVWSRKVNYIGITKSGINVESWHDFMYKLLHKSSYSLYIG